MDDEPFGFSLKSPFIQFYLCHFLGDADLSSNKFPELTFTQCTINKLEVDGGSAIKVELRSNHVRYFSLDEDTIQREVSLLSGTFKDSVLLTGTYFKDDVTLSSDTIGRYLSFNGSRFNGFLYIHNLTLPEELSFENVDLTNLKGEVDLTNYKPGKSLCWINLYGADISKFRIRFSGFRLKFPEGLSFEEKAYVYQQLINKMEKDGLYESHQALSIEFKQLKYQNDHSVFLNWLDKNWWGYGFNKFLIVRNAILICFIFFVINCFLFNKLLTDVYNIKAIAALDTRLKKRFENKPRYRSIIMIPVIFIYTSYIFWGLKLDVEKLTLKSIPLFVLVMFQYLSGIVCLAYLANFILSK
ncbi:hypothetical protein [Mucilaginibacter sp.]|uniref:hypothetical protein n=1 Tax=Mucilaginibacter sp. TaxID=1882438 RepID=UPI002619D04E|nr:hypothetical protein [Mucilaginibacter sp.]MDB4918790.1 Uncharacterized protein [Mucilaginibacter sp.]